MAVTDMISLNADSPETRAAFQCDDEPGCHMVIYVPVAVDPDLEDVRRQVGTVSVGAVWGDEVELPLLVGLDGREEIEGLEGAEGGPPGIYTSGHLNYRVPGLVLGTTEVVVRKGEDIEGMTVSIRADFVDGCTEDDHCRRSEICVSNSCLPMCEPDGTCQGYEQACVDGACHRSQPCPADALCQPGERCDIPSSQDEGTCTVF
jgi:hypothetical protein